MATRKKRQEGKKTGYGLLRILLMNMRIAFLAYFLPPSKK
jgi:hypothetical protein